MQVKVSKVFAKFINATAKEMGFEAEASVVKLSEKQMGWFMGSEAIYDAMYYGDFDRNGNYTAIKVIYPCEYYANPRFIGTMELVKEFNRRGCKTMQDLKNMIRDMVEI